MHHVLAYIILLVCPVFFIWSLSHSVDYVDGHPSTYSLLKRGHDPTTTYNSHTRSLCNSLITKRSIHHIYQATPIDLFSKRGGDNSI
jgi:hypothetical protein